MRRIVLPGTPLEVSRLGFGTASLHHLPLPGQRQALIHAALDLGFTHFDTARMYGEGMAERSLGSALGPGLRARLTLASKIGIPARPWLERLPALMYAQKAWGRFAGPRLQEPPPRALSLPGVEASLRRTLAALRTDWLDLLLIHEPRREDLPLIQALTEWLVRQKTAGRVRCLGLAGQAASCLDIRRALPGVFDVLQVEDSLESRTADRLMEAGLPLQITFGYMKGTYHPGSTSAPEGLRGVLERNPQGMILMATRKPARLEAWIQAVRTEDAR